MVWLKSVGYFYFLKSFYVIVLSYIHLQKLTQWFLNIFSRAAFLLIKTCFGSCDIWCSFIFCFTFTWQSFHKLGHEFPASSAEEWCIIDLRSIKRKFLLMISYFVQWFLFIYLSPPKLEFVDSCFINLRMCCFSLSLNNTKLRVFVCRDKIST